MNIRARFILAFTSKVCHTLKHPGRYSVYISMTDKEDRNLIFFKTKTF